MFRNLRSMSTSEHCRWRSLVLKILLLVAGCLLCSADGDSQAQDDNESNSALVSVETEDDQTGEMINKFNGEFGKDVYDPNLPDFQPTHEWQTVRQGQAIPKGLHVRLNMETGTKEAKLMPDDDGSRFEKNKKKPTEYSGQGYPSKLQAMKDAIEQAVNDLEAEKKDGLEYWKEGDRQGMVNLNKKTFNRDELKSALKKFKASQDDSSTTEGKENFYRKIEDIKKEFKDMKVDFKTDFEILLNLFNKYKDPDLSTANRVNILTDFEYYLHQIDNAINFAEMGGLEMVIGDLNSTHEEVRSEAAYVIGSAVQSNPTVQISAIESGAMQQLIRMLPTESNVKVKQRIMYALSSLIRHFPHAQKTFMQLGGVQALSDLFTQKGTEQVQMKAVTLIADILFEIKTNSEVTDSADANQKTRAEQYKGIKLGPTLREQGWCMEVPKLLSTTEHDSRERVLGAMSALMGECESSFSSQLNVLSNLKREYTKLSADELNDDDQYFTGILHTINSLIDSLDVSPRDEL